MLSVLSDILDIVVAPVDMVSEALVQILSGIKTVIQYISTMFGGIEGTAKHQHCIYIGYTHRIYIIYIGTCILPKISIDPV